MFLNPLLRPSIVPCLLLVLKLYGYAVFLRSLGFLKLLLHFFMLITLVLFRFPPIPFFMNVPSTLRLIVILFETPWKVWWYLFLTSLLISKWLISSPKLWLDSGIKLLLVDLPSSIWGGMLMLPYTIWAASISFNFSLYIDGCKEIIKENWSEFSVSVEFFFSILII